MSDREQLLRERNAWREEAGLMQAEVEKLQLALDDEIARARAQVARSGEIEKLLEAAINRLESALAGRKP